MKRPDDQHTAKAIVVIVMLFYLFGLYQRAPHIDDAWIGEQVWWLNKEGTVKNVLMRHNLQNEKRLLVYHKLWVWQGWLAVKIFGFSLYLLKSLSLLYLFMLYFLFWYYIVKVKGILSHNSFYAMGALFLLHPLIFKYSFVFRPEIALAATGLLLFIITESFLENRRSKPLATVAGMGLLSGVAFLIHMNGLVYIFATGLLLLFYRRYKALGVYSIVTLAVILIYFLELKTKSDFELWKQQMTLFSEAESGGFSWMNLLLTAAKKLFDEQLRWFHSPAEIGWAILFLVVLIKGYSLFVKKYPVLFYYTLLLSLSLAFVGINKTVKYLILLLPFYFILTVIYFKSLDEPFDLFTFFSLKKRYLYLRMWVVAVLITAVFYDVQTAFDKFRPEVNREISQRYIHPKPNKTIVLAPMEFFYNERGKYKAIVGLFSYKERLSATGWYGKAFFKTAQADSVNYIILNQYNRQLFHITDTVSGDTLSGYKVIKNYHGLMLLKNMELP